MSAVMGHSRKERRGGEKPRWEIIAGVGSKGEERKIFFSFFFGSLNSYAGKGVVQSETHEWVFLLGQQTKTICKVVMGQNLIFVFSERIRENWRWRGKLKIQRTKAHASLSRVCVCKLPSQVRVLFFCVGIPTFFLILR